MQNFRFIGAMVSEFQKEHGQSVKTLLCIYPPPVIILGLQLLFHVKTIMEAEPPIAIPIYTVLPYRVIPGWKSKLMLIIIITPDSAQ